MMPRVLALIPARGGSKGVPNKNVRPIAGKPLILYSIEQALSAGTITDVAVSSDDSRILDMAATCNVLPLRRPIEMAQDESSVIDAIRHTIHILGSYDAVVLMQPTSPLRTPSDIDAAVALFFSSGKPVCSVVQVEDNHPARMYTVKHVEKKQTLIPMIPDLSRIRRQDLPPVYLRNGALYVFGSTEISKGIIITEDMSPYIMPASKSVNIDTEEDFKLIRIIMEENDTDITQ